MTSWDQYDSDCDENQTKDQDNILEAKKELFLRKYACFPLKVNYIIFFIMNFLNFRKKN